MNTANNIYSVYASDDRIELWQGKVHHLTVGRFICS